MLSSPFWELFKVSFPFSVRELFTIGLGVRPDKSLTCWNDRENVVLGVVGGAGVRLLSLPLKDDAMLLDEPAPLIFNFNILIKPKNYKT